MDQKLFSTINGLAGRNLFLDRLMVFASNELRFLFIFVLVLQFVTKHSNKKIAIESIVSVILTLGFKKLFNQIKYRPRPFLTRNANVLLSSLQDSSYLSKHTLLAFAVSTTAYLYNKALGKFLYIFSFFIGLSRVWTGVHYPYDILRSSILGTMTSLFVNKLYTVTTRR
ncbi:phosphatase PAP2 family protein [Metabacillus halosaccharovorans]|uniref:phosphatase PAP2 family protein n=1 Tax=Metabacillus halosaccharovorans TaxID=930124 RepID=UPI001C1F70FC|nr:phosphatase PAP2 family protein [Metabacillus halosaccharovorans]MBU7592257.1 phosphatase PAP2 family protein [Metabacillus halosaccharovorans]